MRQGIYFDRPSAIYEEALPVGNGKLGAMVSGAIEERQIWLNEETVWYGGPRDRINPDAGAHIGEIKRLVARKKMREAEQLAILTLTGVPESQRHFTTLGMVVLNFINHDGEVSNYRHSLDFDTATTTTSYIQAGVQYSMQVHANKPANAIIIHLKADQKQLDFYAGIERGERVAQFSYGTHEDEIRRSPHNGIIMMGNCGGKTGLDFAGAIFGESDGTTCLLGDKIVIKQASEATLYITAATNFVLEDDLVDYVSQQALTARADGYRTCYQRHLQEWQSQYQAASVSLQDSNSANVPPMNRLFEAFESGDYLQLLYIQGGRSVDQLNDCLTLLMFDFGRYTLLSASRCGELPAPLQGLWCRDLLAVWDGKYTTNINLQMAYWPADSTNMSQCVEPYIRFALRVRETGLKTAQQMYNCRGFVLHNNTDLWADTAVQDSGTHCSYWFLGGVWIAIDMYEHFRYTMDCNMLKRVWPIMRDAALFMLDFMDEVDGKLVLGITSAPENSYFDENNYRASFCQMCAMDEELVSLLFEQCIHAAEYLKQAFGEYEAYDGFIEEIALARTKLELPKIGKDGTILEWGFEAREVEPQHRHLSHLIGAYPYNFITEKTPELMRAVELSLEKRIKSGGCQTGWARVWGAGLMARLKRGNDARDLVCTMLQRCGQPNLFSCCNIFRVPKLLDNDKPMQIDGTMGTVQAVAEMLLQSYNSHEIWLLPALPDSWKTGSFSGLRARGNITVGAIWQDGKLQSAVLQSGGDLTITVICSGEFIISGANGKAESALGRATIILNAGQEYRLAAL